MKKVLALLLACLIVLSLGACNGQSSENENAEPGAWERPKSLIVNDEVMGYVVQATTESDYTGIDPVALLASQKLETGTNYRLLCTHQGEDAKKYVIIDIATDTEKKATLTTVKASDASVISFGALGGWSRPTDMKVTTEVQRSFDKAIGGLTGAEYVPVVMMGSQIVSGANYSVLCEIKTVSVTDSDAKYAIVNFYEDKDGKAEITGLHEFVAEEEQVTQP